MSRIYVIENRETKGHMRYVRASTMNGAVRAYADEIFEVRAASTEDLWQASKDKSFDVLNALAEGDKS